MSRIDNKEKPPQKDPPYTKKDQEAVKEKLDALTIEQRRMVCMLVRQIGGF